MQRDIKCIMKDGDTFYPQIFLEEALHEEETFVLVS